MERKIIELGFIDKGTGKHESNRVFSIDGIAPTITASFGYKQPPTMIVVHKPDLKPSKGKVIKYRTMFRKHGGCTCRINKYTYCPTIDTGVHYWHILLIEERED